MNKINIAIDGPAGAGKSTVARLVANKLGFIYVDTGAMYRAVTYKALQHGFTLDQVDQIIGMTNDLDIRLLPGDPIQQVWVNGEDVTEAIRSKAVTDQVSKISQIPQVRQFLVSHQQKMAADQGVVMDGRDIGSHVLPDAEVKIFLTASVRERAQRRYDEWISKGQHVSLEQLEHDIAERDRMDENRTASPLVRAEDAVLLDCTSMSISEVVDRILNICRIKVGGEA